MRRKYKKVSLSKKIVIITILIISLTVCLINGYSKRSNNKIIEVIEQNLKKITNNYLSNNIGYDILNAHNLDNILVINKNSAGEILYVDYNLDRAYEALEVITDVIYEDIDKLEQDNGLILDIPFFIYSNSPLLSMFGPKIYAKVDFIGSVLTNVKSKITNYGFNNALVELFVTIEIEEMITAPVCQKMLTYSYDVLVASKVINGRVPEFYGGLIDEKSANLDIPIT